MDFRFRSQRRIQIEEPQASSNLDTNGGGGDEPVEDDQGLQLRPSYGNVIDDQLGRKDPKGDYLDVRSHPSLMKILRKQGDKQVLFADRVLKFTGSGKMKCRCLLITDFAIYIIDPETDALKRRIALAAVEKMCLSELSDNFIAIIVPTEYDLLMASTRKNEIVTVLVEATKSDYELEVNFSNRFEYSAAAEMAKEVWFEEVEGGVKTRISRVRICV